MFLVHVQFLFLVCFAFLPKDGNANGTKTKNNYLALADTTTYLIRRYFSKHSTTVVIIERSLYSELKDFNDRLLEYVLKNTGETVAFQLYYGQSENQLWEYHVFIIDSEQAFMNISWNIPKTNFERDFHFLIVLTNYTNKYFQTIRNIFTACKLFNIVNVNILLNHPKLGVSMYKYNMFSKTNCHVVQPYLYFQFVNGFEKLEHVFPQKMLTFHGCPLKICGRQNYPMLMFSGNESNPISKGHWSNLQGIDGQLIKMLSHSLNFTIDLLPFPKDRTYFDNRTAHGCYSQLLTKNADIAIGGYSASDPKRFALTPSILYYHSPIVFVVRGKRELDCVNRLGRPFSIPVWNWIFALLLVGTFLVLALRTVKPSVREFVVGERNDIALSNFFAVFLGYPVVRVPKRNFARYLLILWLMMTLVIRSAYQGSLYDSIRIDRFEKVPKRYDDLFRDNYKILVSEFYTDIDIFSKNRIILVEDRHVERLNTLAKLDGKFATVALRDHVISYMEKNFRQGSDLKLIDEQVYQYQTAMYFQKHSVYVSAINNHLRQFNYAGLISQIARRNAKDRRMFRENKMAAPLKAMTNDRIWSLYQVFVWLMALTVVVFCLELLSKYFLILRISFNWV